MKYLHLYEKFKSKDDWEVGDIVVALEYRYAGQTMWLQENYKYEIIEISQDQLKVKEVGYPYSDLEEYINTFKSEPTILENYFSKNLFITLDEWELTQSTNKYNL